MKVKWFGQASFLFTSANGTRIILDPFEAGRPEGLVNYDPIAEGADIVTVSHDHWDHSCISAVAGEPTVIRGTGSFEAKGVSLLGVGSYHDESHGEERGQNTIYCFDLDGLRVCHLGDLGHALGQEQIDQIGQVDLLLTPIGGLVTIGPSVAADTAKRLRARVVVPMHYKTDKLNLPFATVDEFIAELGFQRWETSGEEEITTEILAGEPKVLILPHAR